MLRSRHLLVAVGSASLVAGLIVAAPVHAVAPAKGAPQVISGTGDGVPDVSPIDEPVIITLTHDGSSNFIVKPIGRDGDDGFSWTNEIGPYSGTTFQEMDDIFAPYNKKNPIIAVEVTADGNWSIQIRKLSAAPRQNVKRGSGTGDAVIRFSKPTKGLTRMTLTHDGDSNFIVKPIDGKGETGFSMVNEIGNYRGTVRVPAGTRYMWVQADGAWSYSTR